MNQLQWREFNKELEALVAKFGVDRKVKVTLKRFSYSDTHCDVRLDCAVTELNGSSFDLEKQIWEGNARFFDLKPEWYGQTFRDTKGCLQMIVGLNAGRPKFPVKTIDPGGRTFKFTALAVRTLMTKQEGQ